MKREYRKILSNGWKLFCRDIDSAKWAIIIIIACFVILRKYFHTTCPLVLLTGFPCPACGLTRAGICVLHLDFTGAFQIHPFIYLVIALGGIFIVERYVLYKKDLTLLKWCAIIVLIGMLVFYVWRMTRDFPNVQPMTYDQNNVINNVWEMLQNEK